MKHFCVKLAILITSVVISLSGHANNPTLPQVESPIPALQEGVNVTLTQDQIAQILPWTKNAKDRLERVLFNIEGKNKRDKNRGLVRGIKGAVIDSYPKTSGLLMRYVLNRALAIHKILTEKSSARYVGSLDMRNRLLEASIKLALKYYKNDLTLLKAKTATVHDRTKFAFNYSEFLSHLSKSVMSAQAQYTIAQLSLGFLQWDLYNDLDKRAKTSSVIKDLYVELQDLDPNGYKNDQRALQKVRHMKKIKLRAITEIERLFAYRKKAEAIKREKIKKAKAEKQKSIRESLRHDSTVGAKFVTIKAGTFIMGSPESEHGRHRNERQHQVTITKDFDIMTTEVSQTMWKRVMRSNPSWVKRSNLPVEEVSWYDAKKFIAKLNKRQQVYTYRLPTEAEWEYAARGGEQTAYSFGNNVSDLSSYVWYHGDNIMGSGAGAVGQLLPNPYGLYDMHGNVWEWTEDRYEKYPSGGRDPMGASSGRRRVVRGGCSNSKLHELRSASRYRVRPRSTHSNLGLRLVRTRN